MKKKLKLSELNVTSFITSEANRFVGASAPVCVNPDTVNQSILPVCDTNINCYHVTVESQATNCDIVCINTANTVVRCIGIQ